MADDAVGAMSVGINFGKFESESDMGDVVLKSGHHIGGIGVLPLVIAVEDPDLVLNLGIGNVFGTALVQHMKHNRHHKLGFRCYGSTGFMPR